MAPSLELRLFGDFSLRVSDHAIITLNAPRLQALLAHLALHSHSSQSRQHLSYVFWPDATESQARNNLRQLLHQLRQAFPDVDRFLAIDAVSIGWHPEATVSLDVANFERLVSLAEEAQRARDWDVVQSALVEAVDTYQADLLPSCYDEWITPERERLRERSVGALAALVRLLEERQNTESAITYAHRLVRIDPLDENAARTLMRLLAKNNDRAGALRVYHTCSTTLHRELGVAPSPATREAYERLLRMGVQPPEVSAPPPTPSGSSSLVGRQLELARLQATWRRAGSEAPRVVLVSGEAGIGKSRLVEEFIAWAKQQGAVTASTCAYAAEGQLSLAPVTNWLRSESFQPHLSRLDQVWLTEVTRLLPEITAAFPGLPHPEPISESGQRQRFFESLARAVLAASAPLLLAIDDLQWCDQETLEWLHFLLRYDLSARLILVATIRSDEVSPRHPLNTLLRYLRSSGDVLELPLRQLDAEETAKLAAQVAGREIAPDAALRLFQETEGNPLYIVETVRADAEYYVAGPRSGATSGASRPTPESHSIPPRVYGVIAARLAQVSEPAREILGLAASIGREFRLEVLLRAGHTDEDRAFRALDELWQKRIIREQGVDAYDFTHDKLREVAYSQISAPIRRLFHRQIALAFATLHADDLDPVSGQIAAHYERAGLIEQAIPFYHRAAAVAQRIYARENAIGLLSRARVLVEGLPHGSKRDRYDLGLQLALAPLYRVTKGWAAREVEDALNRALVLCDTVGDERQRVEVLYGLQSMTVVQGKLGIVQAISDSCRELYQRAFHAPLPHFAGVMLTGARLHLGHIQEASDQFEEITTVRDEQQLQHLEESQGVNYLILARAWQSHALWCLGFPESGLRRCLTVVQLARELEQPFNQALASAYVATLQQLSADTDVARDAADEALTLASAAQAPYYSAWAAILVTYARAWDDPNAKQIEALRASIDSFVDTGARLRLPYFRSLLARVYAKAGRSADGLAAIDEAFEDANARGERWWNAELFRLRGKLLDGQGAAVSSIEEALFTAIEVARDQRARSLELRALTTLARVRRGRPGFDSSRAALALLYGQFTEGLDLPDLRAARAILTRG